MCCMTRLSYLMAIVPIAVLLTVSFFVLVSVSRIGEKGIKAFGYAVAGLLWLAALVVFSAAVYRMAQGPVGMKGMMPARMKMECMSQMMQKDASLVKVMPEKGMPSKCQANKGVVSKGE